MHESITFAARDAAKLAAADRAADLIDLYIATALPGGAACLGRPYHLLHRRDFRNPPGQRPFLPPSCFGMPPGLDRKAIASHLLGGRIIIAPRSPDFVDFVEIDLDAKDDAARATLLDRLHAVIAALDSRPRPMPRPYGGPLRTWPDAPIFEAPGIVWRSSPERLGGGLRYRLVFNRAHPREELRERVLEALAASGIEERGGEVEVWPCGERTSRAPLGWGSMLIAAEDGLPLSPALDDRLADLASETGCDVAGYRYRAGARRPVRDVERLVLAWSRLVTAKRCPIERILSVSKLVSLPTFGDSPAIREGRKGEEAAGRRSTGRTGWRSRIDDLYANGAPVGGRNQAATDLVFDLRRFHPSAEALARFAAWLETAPHRSRDLTGPHAEQVRGAMLKSARKQLARLDREYASGKLGAQRAPKRREFPLATYPLPLPSLSDSGTVSEAVLSELSEADRAWIAREPEPTWRRRLGVLLVALRRVQRDHPDAEGVAVPRALLKRIATGNMHTDRVTGEVRSCYVVLRERAEDLGVLGPTLRRFSKRDKSATIYMLPRSREDRVALDAAIARAWAAAGIVVAQAARTA